MSQDTSQLLSDFIQNAMEKLAKKGIILNMENQILQDDPASTDAFSALSVASKAQIACSHHTPAKMLNPSPNYQFANNPGIDGCSNPIFLERIPSNTFLPCSAPGIQSLCSQYSPDYKIVKKYEGLVQNEIRYYYLTKFRSFDGSYFYKIYDNALKVYFDLSYQDIDDSDSSLDDYAVQVFNDFIADSMLNLTEVDLYSQQVPTESNKKSYLSTLIS